MLLWFQVSVLFLQRRTQRYRQTSVGHLEANQRSCSQLTKICEVWPCVQSCIKGRSVRQRAEKNSTVSVGDTTVDKCLFPDHGGPQ